MCRKLGIALGTLLAALLIAVTPGLPVWADPVTAPVSEDVASTSTTAESEIDSSQEFDQAGADDSQESDIDTQDASTDSLTQYGELDADESQQVTTSTDASITDAEQSDAFTDEIADPELEESATAQIAPAISWSMHVQNVGTTSGKIDDPTAPTTLGTTGRALRLEAMSFSLANGGISYRAHVQNVGWQGWVSNGSIAGTTGRALRLEAIQIKLDDTTARSFDIYYRTHVQNFGWLGWAKNGEVAGSSGAALRLEAVQLVIVPKDADASAYRGEKVAYVDTAALTSQAHLANVGWQGSRSGETTIGITSPSARMEAIKIDLGSSVRGGVTYRAHVQNVGWQGWVSNGSIAGTTGRALRLEAIQIKLTGDAALMFDIYYRAYVQGVGWLGWAKNGETAGSNDCCLRMGALQLKLVPKGQSVSSDRVACLSSALALSQSPARSRSIVNAAWRTPSTPSGYCAAWVQIVYSNASQGSVRGDACDLWARMPSDISRVRLTPGMAIAVRHSQTDRSTSSYRYGHVGIYMGDGRVLHSYKGRMLNEPIDLWIAKYDPFGEVRWGFLN